MIAKTLGEGEIAAKVHHVSASMIQESVCPGGWQLKSAERDVIEGAAVPDGVTQHGFAARREVILGRTAIGQGVINAPPVPAELRDKSTTFDKGAELHVVSLSQLLYAQSAIYGPL